MNETELLRAVAEQDWATATKLLYSEWSAKASQAFKVSLQEPWERADDEQKISKCCPSCKSPL